VYLTLAHVQRVLPPLLCFRGVHNIGPHVDQLVISFPCQPATDEDVLVAPHPLPAGQMYSSIRLDPGGSFGLLRAYEGLGSQIVGPPRPPCTRILFSSARVSASGHGRQKCTLAGSTGLACICRGLPSCGACNMLGPRWSRLGFRRPVLRWGLCCQYGRAQR
jgi:hypothetical protein